MANKKEVKYLEAPERLVFMKGLNDKGVLHEARANLKCGKASSISRMNGEMLK